MRTNNMKIETLETSIVRVAGGVASGIRLLLMLTLLAVGYANPSFAEESQAKIFSSPAQAVNALVQAAHAGDEQALETILGAGNEVTSSSDKEEDKLEREQFCQKYKEMHRLVQEPDGITVLYIGAENWPFPIPLVASNGDWHFDSGRGKQEILFRRIGENEAAAIEVCQEFAMAKNASAAKADSEDAITRYAESLSTAAASNDNKDSSPFHGYYFRVVTENHATKKALTLVAYPAEYESSGIKTFVVTRKGIVFEKDLGSETKTQAPQMKARTGSSWHRAV
ncbi:MAG TPA: DUF2950 family protein [Pyrinomonadaceae bacterium]